VGGKEKYGKTYKIFKERLQQELYHGGNSFFSIVQTFSGNVGQRFSFSSLYCVFQVYLIYFKSFSFGTFWHKNVLALAVIYSNFLSVERYF